MRLWVGVQSRYQVDTRPTEVTGAYLYALIGTCCVVTLYNITLIVETILLELTDYFMRVWLLHDRSCVGGVSNKPKRTVSLHSIECIAVLGGPIIVCSTVRRTYSIIILLAQSRNIHSKWRCSLMAQLGRLPEYMQYIKISAGICWGLMVHWFVSLQTLCHTIFSQ